MKHGGSPQFGSRDPKGRWEQPNVTPQPRQGLGLRTVNQMADPDIWALPDLLTGSRGRPANEENAANGANESVTPAGLQRNALSSSALRPMRVIICASPSRINPLDGHE
jgi:hypothetical protein